MTEHSVSPLSSLLSKTAIASRPGKTVHSAAPMVKTAAEWEIAFVGRSELPVIQFKHIEPLKVLSNIVVELGWLNDRHIAGRIVLPKGLRPADGVRVKIDDEPVDGKLPFETVPGGGGMVRLNWKSAVVQALYEGNILSIHAVISSNKRPITYRIALSDFSSVADRLKELISHRKR